MKWMNNEQNARYEKSFIWMTSFRILCIKNVFFVYVVFLSLTLYFVFSFFYKSSFSFFYYFINHYVNYYQVMFFKHKTVNDLFINSFIVKKQKKTSEYDRAWKTNRQCQENRFSERDILY
jgi:hypothetical protein